MIDEGVRSIPTCTVWVRSSGPGVSFQPGNDESKLLRAPFWAETRILYCFEMCVVELQSDLGWPRQVETLPPCLASPQPRLPPRSFQFSSPGSLCSMLPFPRKLSSRQIYNSGGFFWNRFIFGFRSAPGLLEPLRSFNSLGKCVSLFSFFFLIKTAWNLRFSTL